MWNPWPGIKLGLLALGVRSLSHWIIMEAPKWSFQHVINIKNYFKRILFVLRELCSKYCTKQSLFCTKSSKSSVCFTLRERLSSEELQFSVSGHTWLGATRLDSQAQFWGSSFLHLGTGLNQNGQNPPLTDTSIHAGLCCVLLLNEKIL